MSNVTAASIVLSNESHFSSALAHNDVSWAQESQFAIQQVSKTKVVADAAMRNPASLQNALINIAAIGISLNPARKHAYLVPRDGGICLDVSYIGLMHLAVSTGDIVWGQAHLVHELDDYQNNGIGEKPSHKFKSFGDRGDVVGAYCTAKLACGDYLTEEMDRAALDKVRSTSKAQNGPWKSWPEEMMRKTVVKRASKYWQCGRVDAAVGVINEHEGLTSAESNPQAFSPENAFDPHTQEQMDYFTKAIRDSDEMAIYIIYNFVSEGVRNSLFSALPKGHKTKITKQAVELKRSAEETIASYIYQLGEFAGDDAGTLELIDEIKEYPKKVVDQCILPKLSSECEMYVRKLIDENRA